MRLHLIQVIAITLSGSGMIIYSVFLKGAEGWIVWSIGMLMIQAGMIYEKQHKR